MNADGVKTKRGGRYHHTTVSKVVENAGNERLFAALSSRKCQINHDCRCGTFLS